MPKTLGNAFKARFGLVTCCSRATFEVWYLAMGRGLNILFFFSLSGVLSNSSSRSNAAKSSSKCRVALGRICLMIGGAGLLLMY